MPVRAVLYSRDLPGGGYVAIDAQQADGAVPHEASTHHARLWVERRADPSRRTGHTPPIIAQSSGPALEDAMVELRAIAADNVSLAEAMRRWARRATA